MIPNANLVDCGDELCELVLGAAIEVHRELGPGLLESPYENALLIELKHRGVHARSQIEVPAFYKGHDLGLGFRADIIVEEKLLLELKCVKELDDLHLAQTMTYLKLLGFKRGYLLNFYQLRMKDGIRRVSI
jgi:GxxExxY protein